MRRTYYDTDNYHSQPTERELKTNVIASVYKAAKSGKGQDYEPVTVISRSIATSWWGRAWCDNLERYADYSSRLERGRRYLRMGTVIDLKIKKGHVTAKVQGTRKTPYNVSINISPIDEDKCQRIMSVCGNKIESLERLLNGDFPMEYKDVFLDRDGLFPNPKEINFNCSCPDWAIMCKHVSAVLYGIAVRFDQNPRLFFELRGIDVDRFVDITLENSVESMLKNVNVKSNRILADADVSKLFGL